MKLQKLYGAVRQAVDDYHMIEDGDVIAVGVSGGKDSLALLYALSGLQRFYPHPFRLEAILVDLGWESGESMNESLKPVSELCDSLRTPLHVIRTSIGKVVFQDRGESNPCSLCAKLRKGSLNRMALELGCNKVAYGHHRDDFVETAMLSLLYEGSFYCFPPVTHLDRTGLTVIRPMMYVEEADIIGFRNRYQLPVYQNPCPADGATKRQYVKELLSQIERDNHGAKKRLFHAITEGHICDWPERSTDPS